MAQEQSSDTLEAVAQHLLERYEPHVAALMAYGSRVFGRARVGSAYDFWLIVRDLEAFHRANAEFYRTRLNVSSDAEEQIALNRTGPLFYAYDYDGKHVKLAVLDEERFEQFCVHEWWTVKGRMQKPLRAFRMTPRVEQAILSARREGLVAALSLVPPEFSLEELLFEIAGLSYRAEIRPERKEAKIRSILDAGRAEMEAIYRPLLAELPYVAATEGGRFADRRAPRERALVRDATLQSLRRSKWSRLSLRFIWRNYRSHRRPIRYVFMKVVGEMEKTVRRKREKDQK